MHRHKYCCHLAQVDVRYNALKNKKILCKNITTKYLPVMFLFVKIVILKLSKLSELYQVPYVSKDYK